MGRLFANFEPYDVQATRYEAKEEGREEGRVEGREQEIENGIRRLVHASKKHGTIFVLRKEHMAK